MKKYVCMILTLAVPHWQSRLVLFRFYRYICIKPSDVCRRPY